MVLTQALKDFMKKYDIEKVGHIADWHGFECFMQDFGDECPDIGLPEIILRKGSTVRWANDDEINKIFNAIGDSC